MIKVTVPAGIPVRNQSGVAKASGKPYSMDFQTVYVHTFGKDGNPLPYPEKIEIILDRDEKGIPMAYPAGDYLLSPTSFYVDRSGNLAVAPKLAQPKPRG